jgi:hypothetical protein
MSENAGPENAKHLRRRVYLLNLGRYFHAGEAGPSLSLYPRGGRFCLRPLDVTLSAKELSK